MSIRHWRSGELICRDSDRFISAGPSPIWGRLLNISARCTGANGPSHLGFFVSKVIAERSKQPRRHIDRQRDQGRVEEKCQHAMHSAGSAHFAAGEAHIGGLPGGADNAGKIQKIAVVRRLPTRKTQPAMLAANLGGVVVMGVVQGKHHLRERPR